jgi:retinol dehydrogenase 12
MELLLVRELANQVTRSTKSGRVVVSILNPGFVDTAIMRESSKMYSRYLWVLKKIFSRTAEEGGRILVNAAEGGQETHGQYLDDCKPGQYVQISKVP